MSQTNNTRRCLKCQHENTKATMSDTEACPKCGAIYSKVSAALAPLDKAMATGDWSSIPAATIEKLSSKVIISTLEHVPGATVTSTIDVISADFAYAWGGVFEAVAGLARNIAGSGNSWMTTDFMIQGRRATTLAIRRQAMMMGADAVIGLRYHFQEFSGANQRGVLVIAATGTAVKTKDKS